MSYYEDDEETNRVKTKKPVIITTGAEWAGIATVIILAVVAIVLIYFLLKPRIRTGSTYEGPALPTLTVSCPTSVAPVNLTAFVGDVSRPSFDASWDPVLIPTTAGSIILGYNVYVSDAPNITKSDANFAGFAPVPQVRVIKTHSIKLKFNTTYYFKVSTLDTCGEGPLSTEEFEIET
jgi:hypothetical protein